VPQHDAAVHSMAWRSTAQHAAAWHSMHNTYSAREPRLLRCSLPGPVEPAQGTARHGMARHSATPDQAERDGRPHVGLLHTPVQGEPQGR